MRRSGVNLSCERGRVNRLPPPLIIFYFLLTVDGDMAGTREDFSGELWWWRGDEDWGTIGSDMKKLKKNKKNENYSFLR